MKRFIVATALVLATLASQAQVASWKAIDFLNGQNAVLTNNFTATYPALGTYFVPHGQATNLQAGVADPRNSNITASALLADVTVSSDVNGGAQANAAISVTYGDPNLWPLPGQPNSFTNGYTSLVATNISSTNFVTYTFVRSTDGVRFGTTAPDQFVFSIQNAPTGGTVTTNVPSGFFVGARKVRLKSILTSSSTSSVGVIIDKISLDFYGP